MTATLEAVVIPVSVAQLEEWLSGPDDEDGWRPLCKARVENGAVRVRFQRVDGSPAGADILVGAGDSVELHYRLEVRP